MLGKKKKRKFFFISPPNTFPPNYTYPADKTIVELFEAQVARTPNDEAVRLGDRSLSYGQLNERANQMAAHLRTLGAGPERLVTLYMEHSIEVVCAILGVLKAGAAYVPVDPATTPKERLAFILQDISEGAAGGGFAGAGHSFAVGEQGSPRCRRSGYAG